MYRTIAQKKELVTQIQALIDAGALRKDACKKHNVPTSSFYNWSKGKGLTGTTGSKPKTNNDFIFSNKPKFNKDKNHKFHTEDMTDNFDQSDLTIKIPIGPSQTVEVSGNVNEVTAVIKGLM